MTEWPIIGTPQLAVGKLSLTVEQRFTMMLNVSRTILRMLKDNGHKKPFEII